MTDWGLRTVPAELARGYVRDGHWTDDTLGQLLADGLARAASQPLKIRSAVRPWSGTIAEVVELARRVAGGLSARGIGPGDVVAFQLPNWMEAAATFWAASFLGAVVVPIVHFYGPKEVGYILGRSRPRALVTADRFGHLDFLATLEEVLPSLPELETVAVVGDEAGPFLPFARLAAGPDLLDEPVVTDPSAPALVAYTSGTTSDPKGVIHSHRTIGFEIRQLAAMQARGARPNLTGAPVGHGIGMLAALLLPVYRGEPIHLIDVWDPKAVLAAMVEDEISSGAGATFFLTSLLDHPDLTPRHLALMRHVGLGGATVPAAVADRATALGLSLVRLYGSTEHPSTTGSTHDDPAAKRLYTDGRPLPGVELRLVDEAGRDVEAGSAAPGEILSRGPDCFMGYTVPSLTDASFDADGWYATGDVGVLDADGYLAITDRKKDIIIRGGENISALEVEELLLRLPGVAEVAVVAAPDERLGEHACAFVRLVTGPDDARLGLPQVRAHLEAAGLARQKWPEELRLVSDFPRTASGKIQKFALRDRLRSRENA